MIPILKEMCNHAVQWGYLDANPAQYVERPRVENEEIECLTPPQIRRLVDAAEEPLHTLLLTPCSPGCVRGSSSDCSGTTSTSRGTAIHVRRSLWRGKLTTPKSRRSRRSINLAPTLKAALARLPSRFKGDGVFTSADGKPIDPDNFSHRDWARVLRQ